MKTISIIVPVYNAAPFLEKCIGSIIGQTYPHLKIILVDDGSRDGGGQICDDYARKDSRIVVIHKENGGLCSARNAGLRIAEGDYIGFVDADDWIAPDMYEYLLENAEKNDADITACCHYRVVPGKTKAATCDGIDRVFTVDEAILEMLKKGSLRVYFWDKLFKRDILNGFFFPEGRNFEGTATMHRLVQKANKVLLLGRPKYYYRDNPKSIVNTYSIKNILDHILAKISRFNDLATRYPQYRRKLFKNVVKGVRKFRFLKTKTLRKEIERYRKEFDEIKVFLSAHWDEVKEFYPRKTFVRVQCALLKQGWYSWVALFMPLAKMNDLQYKVMKIWKRK